MEWAESDSAGGVITRVGQRRSLFYRSNAFRQKLIAANISQLVVVVAVEPAFSPELLTRCLIAAESQGLETLIVLNKCDLSDRLPAALSRLRAFERASYRIVRISARLGEDSLKPSLIPCLSGRTNLLAGQSGMGKSTLINALVPGAGAATREFSEALDSGRHTTTRAALYRLDVDSALIDSPGVQEFGLSHLSFGEIEHAFPEFRPFIGACRFNDCRHDREPDCAIRAALDRGEISERRYAAFRAITGK